MRPSLVMNSTLYTPLNITTRRKDENSVMKAPSKEHYRRMRSAAFRFKRQQMRDRLIAQNILSANASDFKLAKNKNRQDAARKRVRDQNGKFQGGLIYRRPRIIFAIEKVVRKNVPVAIETSANSNSSCEQQVHFVECGQKEQRFADLVMSPSTP